MQKGYEEDLRKLVLDNKILLYQAPSFLFDEDNISLISLFQFLGLKHRTMYSLSKEDNYVMSSAMKKILYKAICDAGLKYFIS